MCRLGLTGQARVYAPAKGLHVGLGFLPGLRFADGPEESDLFALFQPAEGHGEHHGLAHGVQPRRVAANRPASRCRN